MLIWRQASNGAALVAAQTSRETTSEIKLGGYVPTTFWLLALSQL